MDFCFLGPTLFLPFQYFIAPTISPSGNNEAELSMGDRLRKGSHHWLGMGRVPPAIRARNMAIVVKSGKKVYWLPIQCSPNARLSKSRIPDIS